MASWKADAVLPRSAPAAFRQAPCSISWSTELKEPETVAVLDALLLCAWNMLTCANACGRVAAPSIEATVIAEIVAINAVVVLMGIIVTTLNDILVYLRSGKYCGMGNLEKLSPSMYQNLLIYHKMDYYY